MSELNAIPAAAPTNAPPIGPPGVSIAPMIPICPTTVDNAAPPKAPTPTLPITSLTLLSPKTSFILLENELKIPPALSPSAVSLPNINSWNVFERTANAVATPNKAPPIGPPGNTHEGNIPKPRAGFSAPNTPAPTIMFLFSLKKS